MVKKSKGKRSKSKPGGPSSPRKASRVASARLSSTSKGDSSKPSRASKKSQLSSALSGSPPLKKPRPVPKKRLPSSGKRDKGIPPDPSSFSSKEEDVGNISSSKSDDDKKPAAKEKISIQDDSTKTGDGNRKLPLKEKISSQDVSLKPVEFDASEAGDKKPPAVMEETSVPEDSPKELKKYAKYTSRSFDIPANALEDENWVNFMKWFCHANAFSKHKWNNFLSKSAELISKCYGHKKQGCERKVLENFEEFGGIVLQEIDYHNSASKVVAAAVVELSHRQVFDNSDDDHECMIIHYHTHFGKDLRALFYYLYKYMEKFGKLTSTKYVYYCVQDDNFGQMSESLRDEREAFLERYHFDLNDDLCVFAEGKYFAAHGHKKFFPGTTTPGFFDEACKTIVGQYQVREMYNLPIVFAKIEVHREVDAIPTCTYQHQYCAPRTIPLQALPLELRIIKGSGKSFEWKDTLDHIYANSDITKNQMNLERSGSIPVPGDDRCCAFDCVWKMLKYHPESKDEMVAESMMKQRKDDFTQFQDLRIWRKSDKEKRLTFQEIMQKHGYEFMALKDVLKKKVRKGNLLDEMYSCTRFGMFICNLECVHGSNNHTVAIAKGRNGQGYIYDSNIDHPMELCADNLDMCLKSAQSKGFALIVELRRKR